MPKKLPKKLDLAVSSRGGYPHFYTRNYEEGGDYATVGYYVGDIQNGREIYLYAYKGFNTPHYLQQLKDHLLAINPELTFSCDQPNNSFVDLDTLFAKCTGSYKLMSFEEDLVKNNLDFLHGLYLAAKPVKLHSLPSQYDNTNSTNMFPYHQVFHALTEMIHG